ncbi:MAG: Gfo/Idh/MocA family oxidoreductase [Pirellulales bacterium]
MSTDAFPNANPRRIRLAMLGMVEENGHPFSWSAIINGRFDPAIIRAAGYGVISDYLSAQPESALGLAGAEITHIWCDRPEDASAVAQSARIEHCLSNPEEAIGVVDAVIIPTDKGEQHLDRARPFVEAGVPVFIDKPLTVRRDHLQQFVAWHEAGKRIGSSSAMRYAQEFLELRQRLSEIGKLRLVVATCAKSWERYGIHALEAVYGLLPPGGWQDVCNTGSSVSNVVHIRHDLPADVVIVVNDDMFGGFCHVTVYGTSGRLDARFRDSFAAFKTQLETFIDYVQGRSNSIGFNETVEQCKIIIAGIESREDGGRRYGLEPHE